MQQDKLLFNLIEEITGEGNGRIVNIIFNKKDVNEFLIAKKMELTVNQVRNILYKLSNFGLVSFIRKKDQRKGWYIYYWTLDNLKSLELIKSHLQKKIDDFNIQLNNRENRRYFVCPSCKVEVGEEIALENEFVCEECAVTYNLVDNTANIRDIKSKITRVTNEMNEVDVELNALKGKERKKIERENKKIADQKAKEKEEKKAEKEALKKNAEPKVTKKKKAITKKVSENKPKKELTKKTILKSSTKKNAAKTSTKVASSKKVTKKK